MPFAATVGLAVEESDMANKSTVGGVHRVPGHERVFLIEIEVAGDVAAFDFGDVTQELPDEPRPNWQVAYDEKELGRQGGIVRFAFFFHYLDPKKPLLTSFGAIVLPAESPIPQHLRDLKYEGP